MAYEELLQNVLGATGGINFGYQDPSTLLQYLNFLTPKSNWAKETMTERGPSAADELAAYQTAYEKLIADKSFGRVPSQELSAYYDLATRRAFGEGNERINQMLAERGFGPSRVGMGAEMAGRLSRDIELARAAGELDVAQQATARQAALQAQAAASRYGALTRGGSRTIERSGWQGLGAPMGGLPGGGTGRSMTPRPPAVLGQGRSYSGWPSAWDKPTAPQPSGAYWWQQY